MRNPLLAFAAMMGLPKSAEAQSQEELRALAEYERSQARRALHEPLPSTDDEREQTQRIAEQYRLEAVARNRKHYGRRWRELHHGGVDWDNVFRDDAARVKKANEKRVRKAAKHERDELRSRVGKVLANAFVCDTRAADQLVAAFDERELRRVAFGDGQPRWLHTWRPTTLAFDIYGAEHHSDREIYEAERTS